MRYERARDERAESQGLADGLDPWDRLLSRIIDAALAGCIFGVPFLLGGRIALGRLTLVVLAVSMAVAWALRQLLHGQGHWRRSGAEPVLAAGAILLIVQLLPLPFWLLARLSPQSVDLLPLWTPGSPAGLGSWTQISLAPAATKASLVSFLAYCLIFLVTVQRIRSVDDVERILRWCALSAALMAAFGIVQFLTSNGKFFWFFEHPFSRTSDVAKGAFANRNHFAHFLALGTGPLIWWIQRAHQQGGRRLPRPLAGGAKASLSVEMGPNGRILALGVVLFAVLLSLSRGGAVATFLAAAVSVVVCWSAGAFSGRFMASLAAAAVLIAASMMIYGSDRLTQRLDDFAAGSFDALDRAEGRRTIWKTTLKAIPDFLWLGAGAGSLRSVYPIYLPWQENNRQYYHAENGYLEVALDTGIAGLGLLLSGIAFCALWCVHALRGATKQRVLVCAGAVSAGLAASVVHSFVDFVWYVPACMTLTVILAACACRLRQITDDDVRRHRRIAMPRPAAMAAAALLLALGTWMLSGRVGAVWAEPHWFRYQIMQRDALRTLPFDDNDQAEPANAQQESETALAMEQKAVYELEQVVRWDPELPEARLKLAGAYLRVFDRLQAVSTTNAMPLSQISEAALRSQFPTPDALRAWIARAVGEPSKYLDLALWHTRQGLAFCPLEGEGYLYLGELSFLEGNAPERKSAYLAQAFKVRPHDGSVLFYAGQAAALAGDYEKALSYWQRSFRAGRPYQQQLIDNYAGRMAPDLLDKEIVFFLDTFQPDLYAFRLLYRRYQAIARPEQLAPLQLAYAQALEVEAARLETTNEDARAAAHWLKASQLNALAGNLARQAECIRRALRIDPNNYAARYRLACCLADQQELAEAERLFRWCLQRKPGDRRAEEGLRQILQSRMEIRPAAAVPGPRPYQ